MAANLNTVMVLSRTLSPLQMLVATRNDTLILVRSPTPLLDDPNAGGGITGLAVQHIRTKPRDDFLQRLQQ